MSGKGGARRVGDLWRYWLCGHPYAAVMGLPPRSRPVSAVSVSDFSDAINSVVAKLGQLT